MAEFWQKLGHIIGPHPRLLHVTQKFRFAISMDMMKNIPHEMFHEHMAEHRNAVLNRDEQLFYKEQIKILEGVPVAAKFDALIQEQRNAVTESFWSMLQELSDLSIQLNAPHIYEAEQRMRAAIRMLTQQGVEPTQENIQKLLNGR